MSDYILLVLAIVCFSLQFVFMRFYEKSVDQNMTNMLIMLVVVNIFGALLYLALGGFNINYSAFSIFWASVYAIIMIPYFLLGIKVLSLGSLAIYSIYMMLGGMFVPFLYGIIFLQEEVTIGKILGCMGFIICVILQYVCNTDKEKDKEKKSKKDTLIFLALCLLIFFINGFTGVIAKVHQIDYRAIDEISFTVISCAITAIISFIMLVISILINRKKVLKIKLSLKVKPLLIMLLLGVAMHTGNFFHLKAAINVPASVQFPLVSSGVIVLSAICSFFVFKEEIKGKERVALVCAFISAFLFAF